MNSHIDAGAGETRVPEKWGFEIVTGSGLCPLLLGPGRAPPLIPSLPAGLHLSGRVWVGEPPGQPYPEAPQGGAVSEDNSPRPISPGQEGTLLTCNQASFSFQQVVKIPWRR